MNNKLPKDWEIKTLGDIIKITSGSGLTKSKRNDEGKYLVYGGNGITGKHDKYLFEEDRLIIGRVGVHCGNAYITKPKSWVTDNAFVVSFNEKEIDKKFLLNLIGVLNLNNYSVSTAQPVISQGTIYPIEVILPPLETQQAIVSKIEELFSELDKGIEDLKTAQQQLKTYRQSVLKCAFEGKLTNENIKDGALPKGWEKLKIKDICEIKGGKNQSKVINPNGKYPIYGSSGIFGFADEYICDENTTIIGRKGNINSPLFVTTKFWNVDTAFGLCVNNKYDNKLLFYFCLGFNFKKLDKSTTIPSLAKSDIQSIDIQVPPMEEQHLIIQEIESRLSVADKMEESIMQSLQQAEALRQSILKKAFSGELV